LCVVVAALMWSLGGLFSRLLNTDTPLGLHEPPLDPVQIAVGRSVFAGLFFLPFCRPKRDSFRPLTAAMVLIYTVMIYLYVSALMRGSAANAIFLQYTAPFWVYPASVWLLGEPASRRALWAMLAAMAGVAVIVAGGPAGQGEVMAMALGSGATYAAVLVCLRGLRDQPSRWLTMLNNLGAAVLLWLYFRPELPRAGQVGFLAVYGILQLGIPYCLIAYGLRSVSPQEAGTITLLEPLFLTLWAYLIAPEAETPPWTTVIGGGIILAALAWRYAPWGRPVGLTEKDTPFDSDPSTKPE
jgi:drug/metabolite transporter (DMT)-like permease